MAPWGTGSAIQQGISAATAAVSALAGGNLSAAVAGSAAPYLAELIHIATTTKDANGRDVVNVEANLIVHAVLGAAVAQASGGSAVTGAQAGKNAVENNFLSVTKSEALNKAIEHQRAGKNLLEASQIIVKDRASNLLVGKLLNGTITEIHSNSWQYQIRGIPGSKKWRSN